MAATKLKSQSSTEFTSGWIASDKTWSYSSVDSPTGIISVNADMTSLISKGMRVSYKQSQALSAYWTFNTNSTADVGSFTMADVGTPTYTAGKFSNALTLDGATDALSITDTATLKPTGEFTIGAWIKATTTATSQMIFQSWSANTNYAGIALYSNGTTGYPVYVVGRNTGTGAADYNLIRGNINIGDNAWHHIVLSVRNNYGQIYIDGVLNVAGYVYTPAYAATNYIRIGCGNDTGSNTYWFNGQIDDLFFINGYALDEGTIRAKYRETTAQGTGNITVTKMGLVTDVGAYSGGATLLTVYHGTDFMLANATITEPMFSPWKAPFGFPLEHPKWSVTVEDISAYVKSSPTANTWYSAMDVGTLPTIVLPIGSWITEYETLAYGQRTTGGYRVNVAITLSTSNSLESDKRFNSLVSFAIPAAYTGDIYAYSAVMRKNPINVAVKTTYYLLLRTVIASQTYIGIDNSETTILRAISAYL